MNKHRYLIFLFSLLLCSPLLSQDFHGGIMAGVAGTQVAGDTYSGYNKAGLFLGGYVSWDFTKHSGLGLELEYFQKGSRKNPDAENNDYDSYLFRVNYIELPVLYQFKVDWFMIEVGPSAGFLLGSLEKFNEQVLSDQSDYNEPSRLTLQINLGFRFYITPKFGAIFRTNNSLTNIRSQTVTGQVWRLWTYGQFNDSLILSMFYQFR